VEQQSDIQKRLLLALTLSFVVFIAFDLFMPKQIKPIDSNNTKAAEQSVANSNAPSVVDSSSAPAIQQSTPAATQPASAAPLSSAPITTFKVLTSVESDKFIYSIDELGRIAQATLLEKKFEIDGEQTKLFNPYWVKPLEIRFANAELNEEALKTPYTTSASKLDISSGASTVTLTQKLSPTTVTKEITFYKDGHFDLKIELSNPQDYFVMPGRRPDVDKTMFMVNQGALLKKTNGEIQIFDDGDDDDELKGVNVDFASSFDRYFASILYNFEKPLRVYTQTTPEDDALVFIQGEQKFTLHGYIGPKESDVLKSLNPELADAIEYGMITFFAKPLFQLLEWFYNLVGNWGWAIVLLTLLIKLVLFPLSYKGMMSMQKLKDLAPQMKEIKDKHGKDPQKMNMKMMEMYKKEGANPMGGCLPMLMQIPIFFAIYRVLVNAVELQGAEWILWIMDLSVKDPWFILPILMGASMWYQQRITPTTMTDPMQQKIFQWLPVVMTVFFVTFPAGLVLYWLVNNVFTIAQQFIINAAYEKQKAIKLASQR